MFFEGARSWFWANSPAIIVDLSKTPFREKIGFSLTVYWFSHIFEVVFLWKIMFFWHRFLHRFWSTFWWKIVPKWLPKTLGGTPPFRSQNRPWRPSGFLDAFWSPLGSLLAPFGSLLSPFGAPWVLFSSLLAAFGAPWFRFGSIWSPLGSLSAPLGSLLLPFHTLLQHFRNNGSCWCNFRSNLRFPNLSNVKLLQ